MRRLAAAIAVATAAAALAAMTGTSAAARSDLTSVKSATARYHSTVAAEGDGYHPFLDCFGSAEGGMGQHYVNVDLLDRDVDALHPEAMVYDASSGSLKLVAVEWIVPNGEGVAQHPPVLFGQTFHLNTELDVWVLHAWIWQDNPAGMFSDWNPDVPDCPDGQA